MAAFSQDKFPNQPKRQTDDDVCIDAEIVAGLQVYNTLGALLTSTLFLGILNSIFVQPVVSAERAVFYRERAAGMYSVGPWYLALVTPLLLSLTGSCELIFCC